MIRFIKKGIDTSDATATENDIITGKTAYVDGNKVTGEIPVITGYVNIMPNATSTIEHVVYPKHTLGANNIEAYDSAEVTIKPTQNTLTAMGVIPENIKNRDEYTGNRGNIRWNSSDRDNKYKHQWNT